ncbi:transposase [Desulfohalobiaceae bacterium Ax17]|uniref:RNA-guided endonuclease InsQ/TnpB family protein n=1 Tax=Desulfovulcanus ferrireducens TaxID=2831190 RepID=UPI00207B9E94|nr:transposase [Desulfovulcanus ferrireducens]MBT8763064.1 transposase [Desulfovulcanus ferrireducens]
MSIMLQGCKYRLYPNKQQKELIEKHFGCCRFVYNYFWAKYKDDKLPSKYKLQSELPTLKKEYPWLKEVNSQSLQVTVHNLSDAYSRAFDKKIVAARKKAIAKARTKKQKKRAYSHGFPNFKSKKHAKQSFTVPQYVELKDNLVYLPKFKTGIKLELHRPLSDKCTIQRASISRHGNKYYIAFNIETNKGLPVKVNPEKSIGLDMGLDNFLAYSDGKKEYNPRYLIKSERRLKRANRQLARKKKHSSNWFKAVSRLQRLHAKVANQRLDFLHKLSSAITKRYDVICVESLGIKNMVKNKYLSRSISDAGWGEFLRQLKYKSEWKGKHYVEIEEYFPSSKACHVCGYVLDKLSLSQRTWTCPACGTVHDRDTNAAINIEQRGLATLQSALGAERPEVTPVERGSVDDRGFLPPKKHPLAEAGIPHGSSGWATYRKLSPYPLDWRE